MNKVNDARKWLMRILAISSSFTGVIIVLLILIFITLVGYYSSKDDSSSNIDVSPINISSNVERYRDVVEKECKQYEIDNCTNIILAIIMQESGGTALDVMQASESLGFPPNTIVDPNFSIQVGVRNFASTYRKATEASQNILQTALQGYNFGSGFINWSIERNGGWTQENAIEFARIYSNEVQRPNGTWRYGDQNYVEHVFRYLSPNDGSFSEVLKPVEGASEIIEMAISEGAKYIGKSKYVFGGGRNQQDIANGYFDCSSFVHYAFNRGGLTLGPLSTATTDTLVNLGVKVNYLDIRRGDLVFFDTYKRNGHVGIYLGDGQFLNCQSTGGVVVASMSNSYWKSVFSGVVVRIIN